VDWFKIYKIVDGKEEEIPTEKDGAVTRTNDNFDSSMVQPIALVVHVDYAKVEAALEKELSDRVQKEEGLKNAHANYKDLQVFSFELFRKIHPDAASKLDLLRLDSITYYKTARMP